MPSQIEIRWFENPSEPSFVKISNNTSTQEFCALLEKFVYHEIIIKVKPNPVEARMFPELPGPIEVEILSYLNVSDYLLSQMRFY